jgi:hypothetical protein
VPPLDVRGCDLRKPNLHNGPNRPTNRRKHADCNTLFYLNNPNLFFRSRNNLFSQQSFSNR